MEGPKRGVSRTQVLRVYSAAEHRRAALQKAEAIWGRMVDHLADRMEGPDRDRTKDVQKVTAAQSVDASGQTLVTDIVALVGKEARGGHPVPDGGPALGFPPPGLDVEARAASPRGVRRLLRKIGILGQVVLLRMADRFHWTLGRFDPKLYRDDVVDNTDFRKFDDGLKMTVDIDAARRARIENLLAEAARAGHCRYGLHRQASALMTCIVPSPFTRDHMHFVDGAAGGYAMAARNLKQGDAAPA